MVTTLALGAAGIVINVGALYAAGSIVGVKMTLAQSAGLAVVAGVVSGLVAFGGLALLSTVK